MQNKGQYGVTGYIVGTLVFFIIWGMAFGPFLNEWGTREIQEQSLEGLEAFLYANMNLWVWIFFILGSLAFFYFGGSG